jgi:hypothetical protein
MQRGQRFRLVIVVYSRPRLKDGLECAFRQYLRSFACVRSIGRKGYTALQKLLLHQEKPRFLNIRSIMILLLVRLHWLMVLIVSSIGSRGYTSFVVLRHYSSSARDMFYTSTHSLQDTFLPLVP